MGQSKQEELPAIAIILKHSFHTLSFTILSLLRPLSFLLLARLTTNPHLLTSTTSSSTPVLSTVLAAFLHASPPLLHLLVSFTCVSALLHALTGHLPSPRTGIAWVVLCLFQACVNLGVEATVAAGVKRVGASGFEHLTWIERAVVIVGIYETMLIWMRLFVRPVVDNAIFGIAMGEECMDKVVVGVAFSMLWVLLLRDEVEQLVIGAGKQEFGINMGVDGFVCWLVVYVTVMTGMVRIVEGVVQMVKFLFGHCREAEDASICSDPVNSLV